MKHTPGPWKLLKFDEDERYCVTNEAGTKRLHREIAGVSFGYSEPAETEQHANAKLIAAAPELLEAIKSALESLEACEAGHAERLLRAAIAKAE